MAEENIENSQLEQKAFKPTTSYDDNAETVLEISMIKPPQRKQTESIDEEELDLQKNGNQKVST